MKIAFKSHVRRRNKEKEKETIRKKKYIYIYIQSTKIIKDKKKMIMIKK